MQTSFETENGLIPGGQATHTEKIMKLESITS